MQIDKDELKKLTLPFNVFKWISLMKSVLEHDSNIHAKID